MRKLFLTGMALLACLFWAGAREVSDSTAVSGKDRLEKLEELADKAKEKKAKKSEKLFSFDVLESFGCGWHMMGGKFDGSVCGNSEIWLNAAQVSLRPVNWFGLSLGLDLNWDTFHADESYYLHPNNLNELVWDNISVQQALYPTAGGNFKTIGSQANIFSLALPLAFSFHMGDFCLRAGAEAVFPVSTKQKENAKYHNTLARKEVKGFDVVAWYYAPFVSVGYDGCSLYCKYVPGEVIPGIAGDFLTAGIAFGF